MTEPAKDQFSPIQRATAAQCVAQMFALRAWSPGDAALQDDIIRLFNTFLMLVAGTAYQLQILPGQVSMQDGSGKPKNPVFTPGGAVQIHDNEQFPLIVNAVDTKGFPVSDPTAVSFSVDDSAVLSLVQQADGSTLAVAGNPGSAVISGTDGNISGTLAVDVTTGTIASLQISAGDVTVQP